ncbi:MAG: DHH family phosphoesterase [Spirochaetes bacterium]|nr:DHH family phosphoesterase [Spirochaetota bacterium]
MLADLDNHKEKFEKIINKHDEFLIIPHYNPDPDALGSSFGLQYLLSKVFNKNSNIYFSGIIGRAENIKMLQILDIPIVSLKEHEEIPDKPVILLDTQPGTGNNPLKHNNNLKIILDHHLLQERSKKIYYADIRENFGSTSSIIYSYFKKYNLKPTVNVATALYYGIQSDVVGEGRIAYKIDFNYMQDLSIYINREKLYAIENPKLPFDYYIHINKGMDNSVIYDDFIITSLGEIQNPDYIGEIADFLIRFEKCNIVLVIGVHNNSIQLSFRSQKKKIHAGLTLKKIVGRLGSAGGHNASAGGKIVMDSIEVLPVISKKLITHSLKIIQGEITSGIPLLSLGDYLNY